MQRHQIIGIVFVVWGMFYAVYFAAVVRKRAHEFHPTALWCMRLAGPLFVVLGVLDLVIPS